MGGYLLKRTAQSLVAIFGVTTLIFFIQRLTGDPTILLLPEGATFDAAIHGHWSQQVGPDALVTLFVRG